MTDMKKRRMFLVFSLLWGTFFMLSSVLFEYRDSGVCDNLYLITCNFFEKLMPYGEIVTVIFALFANSLIYGFISIIPAGIVNWLVKRLEYKMERFRTFY